MALISHTLNSLENRGKLYGLENSFVVALNFAIPANLASGSTMNG
jgi:hypothetical protein